jgi:hypothetical protein
MGEEVSKKDWDDVFVGCTVIVVGTFIVAMLWMMVFGV